MSNLLWPGDHRAGSVFTDGAVVTAMVRVEQEWLAVLVETGIAPAETAVDIPSAAADLVANLGEIEAAAEGAGNPVVPLVAALRERLPEPAASWMHRGLTSQDVVDSALMLCAKEALASVRGCLADQITSMTHLAEAYRGTPMVARTLGQPAVGSTFGLRVANWLSAVLDAADEIASAERWIRVQVGGAVGSMAATTELAFGRGLAEPAAVAWRASELLADRLGLRRALPWHTSRRPVTALGDALVCCHDAWGRIARDVIEASRAEIGELREPAAPGRGGSSTMPNKRNSILSVLVRRAALTAPHLHATVHVAAAEAVEERSDGAWHTEWEALRTLCRRTVVAGSQLAELLAGIEVDGAAMQNNLARHLAATDGAEPEQRVMASIAGGDAAETYRGATDLVIDRVVDRARRYLSSAADSADSADF